MTNERTSSFTALALAQRRPDTEALRRNFIHRLAITCRRARGKTPKRAVELAGKARRRTLTTAFYVGGFEAIGGIESFLYDLFMGLSADHTGAKPKKSGGHTILLWAKLLPQIQAIERCGIKVLRTRFRRGCRWNLPDYWLYLRHGKNLNNERIVFTKLPPEKIYRRIIRRTNAETQTHLDLIYITPYRPAEMWPEGIPALFRDTLTTILVQSATFAEDLRKASFLGKIVELPYLPPIPASGSRLRRSRLGQCRIGFLGRLAPQKNLSYLLEIFHHIRAKNVSLHIFGEGPEEMALKAQALELQLPVVFEGPIERECVAEKIDGCDIFINTSTSEGQCLAALEVLSRGKPLVATPVGAIPEILAATSAGVTIPLGKSKLAADIIERTISDWRFGKFHEDDILAAYSRSYDYGEIIAKYREVLLS